MSAATASTARRRPTDRRLLDLPEVARLTVVTTLHFAGAWKSASSISPPCWRPRKKASTPWPRLGCSVVCLGAPERRRAPSPRRRRRSGRCDASCHSRWYAQPHGRTPLERWPLRPRACQVGQQNVRRVSYSSVIARPITSAPMANALLISITEVALHPFDRAFHLRELLSMLC